MNSHSDNTTMSQRMSRDPSVSPHKDIYPSLEDIDKNIVFPKDPCVRGAASYLQSIKEELHIYHFQTPVKLFSQHSLSKNSAMGLSLV